ncbi:MAG: hypothetical protein HC828_00475 [Blastochloris sp.]|nr:hypothetical protein [Blastochloris sp.]
MVRFTYWSVLLLLAAFLVACGAPAATNAPTAVPDPTNAPEPTDAPTDVPAPTSAPAPTADASADAAWRLPMQPVRLLPLSARLSASSA